MAVYRDQARRRMRRTFLCVLLGTLAMPSCQRDHLNPSTNRIEQFDTLLTPEKSSIGIVADLAVSRTGILWIVDRGNRNVVAESLVGAASRTYGGRGSGPGEFLRPEAINVSDSLILVVDPGNSRVSFMRPDGAPAGQFAVSRFLLVPLSVNSRGSIAVPTMGLDSSLAVVISDSARVVVRMGKPVVPPPAEMDLSDIREQALRGEMPLQFRNNVLPVLGESGELSLVLQTEGIVQYFDNRGQLKWKVSLPDSSVSAARRDYFGKVASEANRTRVPQPRVVSGGRLYNGELWLMLAFGARGMNELLILDSTTGVTKDQIRLNLTGAGVFAVDSERNRIYIAVPDEGLVVGATFTRSR